MNYSKKGKDESGVLESCVPIAGRVGVTFTSLERKSGHERPTLRYSLTNELGARNQKIRYKSLGREGQITDHKSFLMLDWCWE